MTGKLTGETGISGYYDKESMKKSSGKISVWVEYYIYTDSKEYWDCLRYNENSKNCNSHTSIKTHLEIRCREDLYRGINRIKYNDKGEIIYSDNTRNEWEGIPPDSMVEGLKKIVCK